MWGQKCHEKSRVKKDVGICRFFLEDMGRVGCWFQIYSSYVHLEVKKKNEEMMEVWIYSISMWVEMMQFFHFFFTKTGCFNQLGKGNWVCVC